MCLLGLVGTMIISLFKNFGIGSFGKDASGGHWRPSESALRGIVFLNRMWKV